MVSASLPPGEIATASFGSLAMTIKESDGGAKAGEIATGHFVTLAMTVRKIRKGDS